MSKYKSEQIHITVNPEFVEYSDVSGYGHYVNDDADEKCDEFSKTHPTMGALGLVQLVGGLIGLGVSVANGEDFIAGYGVGALVGVVAVLSRKIILELSKALENSEEHAPEIDMASVTENSPRIGY